MKAARYGLVTAGILVLAFGIVKLVLDLPKDLVGLVIWMVGAVVIHDALVAPLVVGIGWILARAVPARARRHLQATLIIAGLITVIAVPMILREGTQPVSKALLLQDYATNLAILLGLVIAANLIAYALDVARDRSQHLEDSDA